MKRLGIWCAGCSTGHEVYSLAMAFAEDSVRWRGWKIDIIGTDVSRGAIARARTGLYSQFDVLRGLPVLQLIRWFVEEAGQRWRIRQEKRDSGRFQPHSPAHSEDQTADTQTLMST